MRANKRIIYEDDLVVVMDGKRVVYKGMEDYEPMKYEPWEFKVTTKDGKGHYELGKFKKYLIS